MTAKPKTSTKKAMMARPTKPAKARAKAKAAKPVVSAKPPVKVGKRSAHRPDPLTLPGHHATKMEHHQHEMEEAEHAHQDPRWPQGRPDAAGMPAHANPRLDQGAIKTRGVPRMNPMINWFRKAPKSKQP